MMNLYTAIRENNKNNGAKQVMSITTDDGQHRTYTYDEMFAHAEQFAQVMTQGGVKRGDRVVIVAENCPEWNIAYLGVMSLGCTAVLVDCTLPKAELLALVNHSDARCIFTTPRVGERVGEVISLTVPVLNILNHARPLPGHPAQLAPGTPDTPDGDEEVAFIIYSSGTTRTATGIMHTHEAMLGTTYAAMSFNKLNSTEKMLVVIPNSHIYGVVTSMLGPLLLGGSMHFIESMTAENVLGAFAEYQPTVFSCVPRVFEMFARQILEKINSKPLTATAYRLFFPLCVKLRRATGFNLGKVIFKAVHQGFGGQVRILCAAGAPMGKAAMEFYYGVGMNLFLNYGLTETNVPVIANSYENYTTDSCGKPYPHVQIKLAALGESDSSEILLKTPYGMKGYFRDEAATAAAYQDGWFKTGDLGSLDSAGNISIVGRCKDNIVLSTGKKVAPDDIERAYGAFAGVRELVICGIPAPAGGHDEVHAFLVQEENSPVTREEIEASLSRKGAELSQYMKISQLHFVGEIPKTSLQKPKRYLLQRLVAQSAQADQGVEAPATAKAKEQDIPAALMELVRQVQHTTVTLSPATRLFEDLGMDSLGSIELDSLVEETFGKSIVALLKPQVTIGQLAEALEVAEAPKERLLAGKFPIQKEAFDYVLFKFYSLLTRWVYRVEVTGLENLPKDKSFILCPNHQTNFDFLWVTMRLTKEQFWKLGCMAKKELFNSSLTSRLLTRVCGMIPIDRDCLNTQAVALCKQKLQEGWSLLIYPEGTRTRDGQLGEFKKGAAMLSVAEDVPIVPVRIKGGFEIFPAGHKLPKLFDFKRMRRCCIQVAFAPPLLSAAKDVDALNCQLRETVANM